jgi:hypothetical protein
VPRVRITVSIVDGDEIYQREHTFAQWEETGEAVFRNLRSGGDPIAQADLWDVLKQGIDRARHVIFA